MVQDYGCGKAHLTFAIHHLLANVHGREVEIVGLDHNPHVIETLLPDRGALGIDELSFRRPASPTRRPRLSRCIWRWPSMRADTATDDALIDAVGREALGHPGRPAASTRWPPRLAADAVPAVMAHGILKERLARWRPMPSGPRHLKRPDTGRRFSTSIDTEHRSPKNLLIRPCVEGRRRQRGGDARADARTTA